MKGIIRRIADDRIPILFKVADNDSTMSMESTNTLLQSFGARKENETILDGNGNLMKDSRNGSNRIKVIKTSKGGHFSFKKYSDYVNQQVLMLLNEIKK